jgi:hypothetical protein
MSSNEQNVGAGNQNSPLANVNALVALQRLDEASTQLQKEGRYLEALECMERGLVLRQRMSGANSEEVSTSNKFRFVNKHLKNCTRTESYNF